MRNARPCVTGTVTSLLTGRLAAVRMSELFVLHLTDECPKWRHRLSNQSASDALNHSHDVNRGPVVT